MSYLYSQPLSTSDQIVNQSNYTHRIVKRITGNPIQGEIQGSQLDYDKGNYINGPAIKHNSNNNYPTNHYTSGQSRHHHSSSSSSRHFNRQRHRQQQQHQQQQQLKHQRQSVENENESEFSFSPTTSTTNLNRKLIDDNFLPSNSDFGFFYMNSGKVKHFI